MPEKEKQKTTRPTNPKNGAEYINEKGEAFKFLYGRWVKLKGGIQKVTR